MASDKGEAVPPPVDLHERTLPLIEASVFNATSWFRIGKTKYAPKFFSQDDGWRFSRRDMPGVLYLGSTEVTCFWEVFWSDLATRKPEERRLDKAKVEERSIWGAVIPSSITVVNTFSASGLQDMSAHAGTFAGPYVICQQWAKALREHPQKPHGIFYESVRNRGSPCLALFEERTADEEFQFSDPAPLLTCRELTSTLKKFGLPPTVAEDS
jgi:hypothetical protein